MGAGSPAFASGLRLSPTSAAGHQKRAAAILQGEPGGQLGAVEEDLGAGALPTHCFAECCTNLY
eukprot:2654105-Alexandrium_andersonii.AAC.1